MTTNHGTSGSVCGIDFAVHPSTTVPDAVNVEFDGDLTGDTGLLIHVNDQLVWDSRRSGADLTEIDETSATAHAEAVAVTLSDAVREAVLEAFGRNPGASLVDLLDAAKARMENFCA